MKLSKLPGGPALILAVAVVLVAGGAWLTLEWGYNRVWVPEGHSMLLRYKGPPLPIPGLGTRSPATQGAFAKVTAGNKIPDELGVLENLVGPGRHFYCPLWWEIEIRPDTLVEPGEVGIVVCKMGQDLPAGDFLVDGDLGSTAEKGILRKVLPPGRYRVNWHAYEVTKAETQLITSGTQVKQAGWVSIPTGYVGVVTNLADNPLTGQKSGIQPDVLPPGIYPINPREQQVDIVNIGYRELSIIAELKQGSDGEPLYEDSGEPIIGDKDSGIGFPSNDGFDIYMDFTAIWGIMPDQAPDVISRFGNVDAVKTNVVCPQIESICRNEGSKLGAVELLVGESRQEFQKKTSERFKSVLDKKGITVLNGLVRHIYIPQEVRTPIQEGNIANELKLTREQEQITTKTEGLLRKAEAEVQLATDKTVAETEKLVASRLAEGHKDAEEIAAETQKLVAAIDKETAEIEASATRLLGEADASAREMSEEAKADKFGLAVAAFGSGKAYNNWVFAQGLPEDIQLDMIYAGDGTFWTDLKGFSDVVLGKQISEQNKKAASGKTPPGVVRPSTRPTSRTR
jgi:regulator of protease activity HflC (stomatin/prohibitin superfamily)